MGSSRRYWVLFMQLLLFRATWQTRTSSKVHIVYMGKESMANTELLTDLHHQTLSTVMGSREEASNAIVYSYKSSFSGFAARLSSEQAYLLSKMPDVVAIFPDSLLQLQTTHSWNFLGLNPASPAGMKKIANSEQDIIVGMIDTGIWPESESFRDDSMPPVPSRWNGECVEGEEFSEADCNRKIIGARWYVKGWEAAMGRRLDTSIDSEYLSARDHIGHGTHTSSIACGREVSNASFFGQGAGTATGGAPFARIAVYKVCWMNGTCSNADLLSAFDDAIADGVDIISLSVGGSIPLSDYFQDAIAIGSFHAALNNITVICAAGNNGPDPFTVSNVAPWLISVAATTIDRSFTSSILLGNNQTLQANAIIVEKDLKGSWYPVVYGANPTSGSNVNSSCLPGSVDSEQMEGRLMLCFYSVKGVISRSLALKAVRDAGGVGLIFAESPTTAQAHTSGLPLAVVDTQTGQTIVSYILLSKSPVLKIGATVTTKPPAPTVPYFSSRGPSALSPDLLKPDVAAPGVNILAAWPANTSPLLPLDSKARSDFNFLSGTSMACPHVTGLAALLKSAHPEWSPAAIRSAIMTTANVQDDTDHVMTLSGTGKQADVFDFGAGQIDPIKAFNPGLVYDISPADYKLFLCSRGYSYSVLQKLFPALKDSPCPKSQAAASNLNYPALVISDLKGKESVNRSVSNVGAQNSTYKIEMNPPAGLSMEVKPQILTFNSSSIVAVYTVIFTPTIKSTQKFSFGSLTWTDGLHHHVKTLIAIRINNV